MEPTVRLVQELFQEDFKMCEESYKCGPGLYAFSVVLRREMECSVRDNEFLNSWLKRFADLCRNISETLANARCILKRNLDKNNTRRLQNRRLESRSQRLLGEAIKNTCLEALEDAGGRKQKRSLEMRLEDGTRFEPPLALADLPLIATVVSLTIGKWRQHFAYH